MAINKRDKRNCVFFLAGVIFASIGASLAVFPACHGKLTASPNREVMKIGSNDALACDPTPTDHMGPFYKPNAPERSSVGEGYVLTGRVKSAEDCAPISAARIELWLAGPDGRYDDDHRGTVFSTVSGSYKFGSNIPPRYGFRPPHIHIRVAAEGYKTLVTQHYLRKGETEGNFDLVLIPE